MRVYACLLCIDGMMPAGIDPIFGPVYRACPNCHTACLGCDGLGTFPAIRDYTLDAVFNVLYQFNCDVHLCDRCTGITIVWTPPAFTVSTQDDDPWRDDDRADTIHRVENVLRDLVDNYYGGCKRYEGVASDALRAFYCAQFGTLAEIGTKLADALGIAAPNWEAIRDLATEHPEPGVNP
jgi:hypothetical protein